MMKKIILIPILFLGLDLTAQISVGELKIPVEVNSQNIINIDKSIKKGQDSIVFTLADTTITFNPESFAEHKEIRHYGKPIDIAFPYEITSNKKLQNIFENPIISLKFEGKTYFAYKIEVYFWSDSKYYGLCFDELVGVNKNYSKHYYNVEVLPTLRRLFQNKLLEDVTEIYLCNIYFVNEKGEPFLLNDIIKIIEK